MEKNSAISNWLINPILFLLKRLFPAIVLLLFIGMLSITLKQLIKKNCTFFWMLAHYTYSYMGGPLRTSSERTTNC